MNKSDSLVASPAAEDFLVASIVNDKTQLSKSKREESGVAQFCPRIVKSCYQQESADEQHKVEEHLSPVISRLLSK